MKRIKTLGLAVFAMFAITGLGAVSAQATGTNPVFFYCAKVAKTEKGLGHYLGKTCSKSEYKETGGNYDLKEGIGKGKGMKVKGGKAVLHSVNPEAKADIPVECASFKGSASVAVPNLIVNDKATFSKCKALGAPCATVGAKKETIEAKTLAGSLGWVSKEGKVVGTDLANQAEPGGPTAEFTCEALGEIRTHGSVIGTDGGNVEAISKESTLTFAPGPYIGEQHAECTKENEAKECEAYKDNWTPIVNIAKVEGGPVDILMTEVKGAITGHPTEFYPPGGIPSGQEGVATNKGEALGIYEEGSK